MARTSPRKGESWKVEAGIQVKLLWPVLTLKRGRPENGVRYPDHASMASIEPEIVVRAGRWSGVPLCFAWRKPPYGSLVESLCTLAP